MGELKYRLESLINMAQHNKKPPLTGSEKREVMPPEMAYKVSADNAWWFGSTQLPGIHMMLDQVARVVVPSGERAKIVEALLTMYPRI